MRWSRALTLPVLLALLVACSGPAASQSTGGTEQSDNPTPTAGASTDGAPSATEGGGAGGDLDALVEKLTPPNSTESSRVSQSGGSPNVVSHKQRPRAATQSARTSVGAAARSSSSETSSS